MRKILAALFAFAVVAGCDNRRTDGETGAARDDRDRVGVDTMIETQRVQDTTIVRADTTIDVDTIRETDHIRENR